MKIAELRLWGFQCFGSADGTPLDPVNPKPVVVSLDENITVLIGRNGAGKSAAIKALTRLFGETRDDRAIEPSDFFVPPGEILESAAKRYLSIEVVLSFAELASDPDAAKQTIPSTYRHMIVDGPGKLPIARIRMEATWQATGTLDGSIEESVFWLTTPDAVPFGDGVDPALKSRMTATDRSSIAVRFIPASRDVAALTRLTVRSLGRNLMNSVQWANEQAIRDLIEKAGAQLDAEVALGRVNKAINDCWASLNAADTETKARLSILPPDFQQIVKAASVVLTPSAAGRELGIDGLSDGQRSLFHFALVKALLDLKLDLELEVSRGGKPPFAAAFMRAPALTLFAFEEPENHLAPFFLSRLLTELGKLSVGLRVQGIVTSHSPAIVGRVRPEAIRHLRRESKSGVSTGSQLILPDDKDEAGKFVREAVRAHPEIYFARHAIFGEGASEEIVLPRLAEALDVPIDRSFVAIVPIGGRYIQHFWRLVTQLGIPSTTLLDLDLGRSSGDVAQFKAAAAAILAYAPPSDANDLNQMNTAAAGFDRKVGWGGTGWTMAHLQVSIDLFEKYGVYFSAPLDLDMMMLEAFPGPYQKITPPATGPRDVDRPERQASSGAVVLGEDGFGVKAYEGTNFLPLFPWYAYLFLGSRGKPAVHLAALGELDSKELAAKCPPVLKRLLQRVASMLDSAGA